MKIQLLKAEDYYTQRNNKLFPSEACMPTARAMFYCANRIEFRNPSVMQDDDLFMSIMRSQAAESTKNVKYAWAGATPANEVHGMYHTFLDPLVTGKRRSDFIDLQWTDYITQIRVSANAIMTSISAGGLAGHAVVFTGYDSETKELLMADPWGDYRTGYTSHAGYEIRVNREQWEKIVKPLDSANNKWAHLPI